MRLTAWLRLAARLRKSKLKNFRVRFFKAQLSRGKTERDERHQSPLRQTFRSAGGLIGDNPDPIAGRQCPKGSLGAFVRYLQFLSVPRFGQDGFPAFESRKFGARICRSHGP